MRSHATDDTVLSKTLARHWSARNIEADDLVLDEGGTIQPRGSRGQGRGAWLAEGLPPIVEPGRTHGAAHVEVEPHELGRGAMGVVHLARQVPLCRDVAVKTLLDESVGDDLRHQMLCEARVTGALEHPNVVPVYMLGASPGGAPVIVMKRITGTPWSELLVDEHLLRLRVRSLDPLVWHLEVLSQVCNAVHYAHDKGIIHRDLKPQNVMIGEFGEVYVLDWGLAVSLRDDSDLGLPHVSEIDCVAGTPSYMPPEVVAVQTDRIGVATDVYLLGAMLHQIVTGKPLHVGKTMTKVLLMALDSQPHDYDESVPAELAAICRRATRAEPAERYQSADELRQAIEAYQQQRHSLRLAAEASERFDQLAARIAASRPYDERAAVEIHRLYGACRFGFQEAFREWPESPESTAGLQRLLETMARYEMAHDNPQSAAALIADLPLPSAPLQAELAGLKGRLAERNAELDAIRKQEDTIKGGRTRTTIVAAMMLIWTGSYFAVGAMMRAGVFHDAHAVFMVAVLAYGAFLGVATVRWRAVLWETRTNRHFVWALWAAFLASVTLWPAAWYRGVPFGDALAINMLLYAVVMWMSKVAVDSRLVWGAPPYAAGALVSAFVPAYAWEALALATVAAMGLAAWVLRSQASSGVARLGESARWLGRR